MMFRDTEPVNQVSAEPMWQLLVTFSRLRLGTTASKLQAWWVAPCPLRSVLEADAEKPAAALPQFAVIFRSAITLAQVFDSVSM